MLVNNVLHSCSSLVSTLGKNIFIALIHPIQYTIANPVSADWPAKQQKKPSCVSTGQAGPVLCICQVAHRTSFMSRQSDVIASFLFGACTVQTDYCCENLILVDTLIGLKHCVTSTDICH